MQITDLTALLDRARDIVGDVEINAYGWEDECPEWSEHGVQLSLPRKATRTQRAKMETQGWYLLGDLSTFRYKM
jgi:hypothetical protein